MTHKKKILFFLNSGVGGGERMTITFAKMLPRDEYEVKFVVVGRQKGEIANFIPDGYDTKLLKVRTMWDFLAVKLVCLLKREKPYAVFSTAMHLNSRLIIAAKVVENIKVVIRNCSFMSLLRWDQQVMVRLTYHWADKIISQQEEMTEEIVGTFYKVDPLNVVTLHNPLDVETIDKLSAAVNPFPADKRVNYLCVARINQIKGQDILAKAFVEVSRVNVNAHLWFVGKYDDSNNFVQEVKEILSVGECIDRVHFVGYDANPYRWMKNCDCYVMTSRMEGLPNALIETQYLGRPCVAATCIPVVDRIIDEGINGFKVPTEDWCAMAEAMVKAVELKYIKMTYKPSDNEEFIRLFE